MELNYLFYGCSSLLILPDISEWNIKTNKNENFIFSISSSIIYSDLNSFSNSNNAIIKKSALSDNSDSSEVRNSYLDFNDLNKYFSDKSGNDSNIYYDNFYN